MSSFEWAADYEALCSPYEFSVSLGPHGKELKATASLAPGQVLLVESPIIAWPVKASVSLDAFTCCENCLKIRPFHEDPDRHTQKMRIRPHASSHAAAPASAARNLVPTGAQPCDQAAAPTQLEASGEEETGVCTHDRQGNALWFCSRRCHQQALGAPISALDFPEDTGEACGTDDLNSRASRKRDTHGYIRALSGISPALPNERNASGCSPEGCAGRRLFGWQEFLPPDVLRTLRLHDQQHLNNNLGAPVEEDSENPIGLEALGRTVARVAATAASLHAEGGLGLEDAYAEACRPFLRLAAAEASEAHAAFDLVSASTQLQAALSSSISAALGSEVAAALLGSDALAFFYGALMRNAQSLLIWGAAREGTLMVLRAAGLYVIQSCCNHSCIPNCCVENGADACITLRAERPIAPGEELTIAYVPLGLPQSRRQELLNNYRFVCDCTRCIEEKRRQA